MVTVCLLAAATAPGQQQFTENTVRLAEGAASPPATLGGMAWLAGSWRGEGLGGQVEEVFRHARVKTERPLAE
jgi:hypothetical protein